MWISVLEFEEPVEGISFSPLKLRVIQWRVRVKVWVSEEVEAEKKGRV